MARWIKLHQSLREHWIWEQPRYVKWWLDLLLLAAWKERKVAVGSKLLTIKRGQLIVSVRHLRDRWIYRENSRGRIITPAKATVSNFLRLLESDNMITQEPQKKPDVGTLITICHYEYYQPLLEAMEDTVRDRPGDSIGDASGDGIGDASGDGIKPNLSQKKGQNKEYIEYINNNTLSKGGEPKNFVRPSVEEVAELIAQRGYHFDAEQFVAFYDAKGWMVGKNKMKDWRAAATTWERREQERIKKTQNPNDNDSNDNRPPRQRATATSGFDQARRRGDEEFARYAAAKLRGAVS